MQQTHLMDLARTQLNTAEIHLLAMTLTSSDYLDAIAISVTALGRSDKALPPEMISRLSDWLGRNTGREDHEGKLRLIADFVHRHAREEASAAPQSAVVA